MSQVMTALVDFEANLANIAEENCSEHKRLKFVNRSLIDIKLVDRKLNIFMVDNLPAERMDKLYQALFGCLGESSICEYLLELIRLGKERIDAHVELFKEINGVFCQARQIHVDDDVIEEIAKRCSLAIYDSMQFLVAVKRVIAEVATIYHVPYYYGTKRGVIRIRSSLLSTHKNINTIIDDLQAMNEALSLVHNSKVLEVDEDKLSN